MPPRTSCPRHRVATEQRAFIVSFISNISLIKKKKIKNICIDQSRHMLGQRPENSKLWGGLQVHSALVLCSGGSSMPLRLSFSICKRESGLPRGQGSCSTPEGCR